MENYKIFIFIGMTAIALGVTFSLYILIAGGGLLFITGMTRKKKATGTEKK
ncbi:MAG: hypothetical protein P8100_08390 [bacterium]|jgi:hypothetical protein